MACALVMYIIASPAYPFFSFFPRVDNLRLLFLLIDLLLIDLGFGFPAFRVPICADEWRVEEKTMSEGGHQNEKFPWTFNYPHLRSRTVTFWV